MQTTKNWCDGERVKKLGILRVSKQGLEIMIKDQFNSSIISPFTDLQWFYTSCSCWYTPKSQANRFPKGKGRRKKYVCLLTSLKKERTKWGARFFLSCVVNDVQMRADPCFNMAVHRQTVSCKIAQLSCKNRSISREHPIRILDYRGVLDFCNKIKRLPLC